MCEYLGGRSDKDFLGTGNIGLFVEALGAKVLFIQNWQESGLFDWLGGAIRSWAPDRIEMQETTPAVDAHVSHAPSARRVFAARNDVLGMTLEWNNDTPQDIVVQASFDGMLAGDIRMAHPSEAGFLYSIAPYSDDDMQCDKGCAAAPLAWATRHAQNETYAWKGCPSLLAQ